MQMTGAGGSTPGNKSPPPPMVQQSVGSAGHSRNVSQSSSKSAGQGIAASVASAAPSPPPSAVEVKPEPLQLNNINNNELVTDKEATIISNTSSPQAATTGEEAKAVQEVVVVDVKQEDSKIP